MSSYKVIFHAVGDSTVDASEMEAAHTHNILNTLTFVTMMGVMWLLFERSPIYEAGRIKLRGIRKNKELKRKIEFMTMNELKRSYTASAIKPTLKGLPDGFSLSVNESA